jgi:hypothetical protein
MKETEQRPLSDTENKEVHFNIDELVLLGDESICQYSGLPSTKVYEKNEEYEEIVIGHA